MAKSKKISLVETASMKHISYMDKDNWSKYLKFQMYGLERKKAKSEISLKV